MHAKSKSKAVSTRLQFIAAKDVATGNTTPHDSFYITPLAGKYYEYISGTAVALKRYIGYESQSSSLTENANTWAKNTTSTGSDTRRGSGEKDVRKDGQRDRKIELLK